MIYMAVCKQTALWCVLSAHSPLCACPEPGDSPNAVVFMPR